MIRYVLDKLPFCISLKLMPSCHPDLEGDVVGDVPAVHRYVPFVVHAYCLIVVAVLEEGRVAPGIAEVIFGAGADSGWEFLAVDEELLIAFAPPSASGVPDVQHNAAETSPAFCL